MSIINNSNKSKKIGILGGTFDPIHFAHINIALAAYNEFCLEKVIFLVNGNPPHKKENLNIADKEHRYNMASLVCDSYNMFEVSRYEIDRTEYSYTYDSLCYFQEKYPDYELCFIMGDDSLFDIEKWKNPEGIISKAVLLTAKRNENSKLEHQIEYLKNKYNAKINIINTKVNFISSTFIRENLSKGIACEEYIPKEVSYYIKAKGLYK